MGYPSLTPFAPKDFCTNCATPLPWASREAVALHIENLLDGQPDLAEGDRRDLEERLTSLRETPAGNPGTEKRQIAALERLKAIAPKAWELAMPIVQAILTAEGKQKLGLPP
jgi:hypothetical protein